MKKACEVLEAVEAVGSRLEKQKLLKAADGNLALRFLLETALNPFYTYGISELYTELVSAEVPTLHDVLCLRDKLVCRELSGDAAREALGSMILCKDGIVCKWLCRAFRKDLRAGVSTKTINKIWPKLIPEFNVGLCEQVDEDKISWVLGWVIEPKYDGIRCIAVWTGTTVTFVSRNNKEIWGTQLIEQELIELLQGNEAMVLDGELYAGNWNDSISCVHSSKKKVDIDKLQYHIFDMMSMKDWKAEFGQELSARKKLMAGMLKDTEHVKIIRSTFVDNELKAQEEHARNLAEGYEGSVVKKTSSLYPFGRSRVWLKWKSEITVDVPIVGYEEGTGRNMGRLGAFVCDIDGERMRVGGGYSDEERVEFWKNREEMIGKIIEVKGQERTVTGKIRFPVKVRIREDR